MLNFCANLGWLFTEHELLNRFAAASKSGFKGVEFSSPYEYPTDELAKQLSDNGLTMALFNLPAGDWSKGERGLGCLPDRRSEFHEGVKRALDYAAALNCKTINCLAGIAPPATSNTVLWNTLADNLNFAAEHLAQENIALVVEPINKFDMPGFFLNTSADGLKAIAAAGHPNIKLQYDIYHMQRMEGELVNTLRRLAPIIGHIQVADNPGRHEPGTGEINYNFIFQALREIQYEGWIGCEYKPSVMSENSLGWMNLARV